MKNKPYAIAVRIYESNGTTMADIKTSPCDGLRDERIKNVKPFEEIK